MFQLVSAYIWATFEAKFFHTLIQTEQKVKLRLKHKLSSQNISNLNLVYVSHMLRTMNRFFYFIGPCNEYRTSQMPNKLWKNS